MPDISKIKLENNIYNIKDATARASLQSVESSIQSIETITQAEVDQITNDAFDSFPSPVYGYDTVADMQADPDLQEGMICHTNGFSTSGDGNAAYYTISNSGTANGTTILALQNGLKAIKVSENNSVVTANIQDSAITTTKIADNAVTADKVASSAADGLRTMSTTQLGVAKVGAGLTMNGDALELDGNGDIATAITSWLNAHPEATTTVEDGAITTAKLADGAVTDAKLVQTGGVLSAVQTLDGYFVGSTNLFNQADPDLVENVELKNDGTTAAKTGYFASGYIPVQAGSTICAHYPTGTYGSASSFVLYDGNKTRIGYTAGTSVERLQDGNGHNYIKHTFPSNTTAKYFRCTGYITGYPYYMYVYANEMPSAYEPYIPNTRLSDSVKVAFANVTDVSVSKSDTDFIKSNQKNLVDLSAMVQGVVANSSTSGAVDASATNWITTDYVPVSPGKTYSLYVMLGIYYGANYLGIPYYNKDKVYLGRVIPNGGRVNVGVLDSITIPSDNTIAYIRTSYTLAQKTNHKQWYYTMIVEGSAWVGDAYIPYDGTERLQGAGLSYEYSQPMNCLFGKLALWNGDSICAADNDPNGGWPLTIAAANGMQAKNYGVAGGTIAENAGANVHSVSVTLDGMLSDFPNADYIIIEGGTNDADLLGDAGIGTFDANDFTDAYINGLDKSTFSGALESVLYRLVTVMKGRHIGYIIPQKMGHTEILVARRRAYFDRAIAICAKWGVPYLDLWNDYYFNWRLSAHWDQTMTGEENNAANNLYRDGQHLTDRGYAVQSAVIAEWMKTL